MLYLRLNHRHLVRRSIRVLVVRRRKKRGDFIEDIRENKLFDPSDVH